MPRRPPKTPSPMRTAAAALLISCASISGGCGGTRVVIVRETEPVQLAEDVAAHVYVQARDGQRVKSDRRVTLREGQWVATVPEAEPEAEQDR